MHLLARQLISLGLKRVDGQPGKRVFVLPPATGPDNWYLYFVSSIAGYVVVFVYELLPIGLVT